MDKERRVSLSERAQRSKRFQYLTAARLFSGARRYFHDSSSRSETDICNVPAYTHWKEKPHAISAIVFTRIQKRK